MQFISVRDLRGKSAEVWKRLTLEKDMVLTSNGRPFAIISKISEDNFEESISAIRRTRAIQAVEVMQSKSAQSDKGRITLEGINQEINLARKKRAK